jgi:hypothetical protein
MSEVIYLNAAKDEPLTIGERHLSGEIFEKDDQKSHFEKMVEDHVWKLINMMAGHKNLLNIQSVRVKKLNDIMSILNS